MHAIKSYTIRDENNYWLGQVVLTPDGMFASVTDYGNFSYAWSSFGNNDFRDFICGLSVSYFGGKMYNGMTFIVSNKKTEDACMRFAEKILPPLKIILLEELQNEKQYIICSAAN